MTSARVSDGLSFALSCFLRNACKSLSRILVTLPTRTTFNPFSAVQRQTVERDTPSIPCTSESFKKRLFRFSGFTFARSIS